MLLSLLLDHQVRVYTRSWNFLTRMAGAVRGVKGIHAVGSLTSGSVQRSVGQIDVDTICNTMQGGRFAGWKENDEISALGNKFSVGYH